MIKTVIEEWDESHPRWAELAEIIQAEGQTDWVTSDLDFHLNSWILVAREGDEISGFLRMVRQPIGPDMGCPPLELNSEILLEAKVLAFGVRTSHRNKGAGRQLQMAAIQKARQMDCYQIRSHSGGDNKANHHLKLSLGFAVHPIIRGDDNEGAYFIMPLQRE